MYRLAQVSRGAARRPLIPAVVAVLVVIAFAISPAALVGLGCGIAVTAAAAVTVRAANAAARHVDVTARVCGVDGCGLRAVHEIGHGEARYLACGGHYATVLELAAHCGIRIEVAA